jgi:hypothetical protein
VACDRKEAALDVGAVSAASVAAIRSIDPRTYVPHALHRCERAWPESNCYVDVWFEVLHALELEPLACAPFALAADFEGDQWTFFKPPHGELASLYGIDVHELTVWRPLIHHAVEQLSQRKIVLTEVDAYFLPDTAGTDYRRQHTKTTIAIQEIDVERRTLGYFHNAGYHALEGQDFVDVFRLDKPTDPTFMPMFAEFARLARVVHLPTPDLVRTSTTLLGEHLRRRPSQNPVSRFAARFPSDLDWLKSEGLATYHAYAFASLRQLGAAFELGGAYLRWLEGQGVDGLDAAAKHCDSISDGAKALVLKVARVVNTKRAADFSDMLRTMEASWDELMRDLVPRFAG